MRSAGQAGSGPAFFDTDRIARCRAMLARDLAASATDQAARIRHLADAVRHARSAQGSLNETLLILR